MDRDDGQVVIEHAIGIRLSTSKLALLVAVDGKSVWIPQSMIHDDSEVYKGDTAGTLIVPEWLAREKGLI